MRRLLLASQMRARRMADVRFSRFAGSRRAGYAGPIVSALLRQQYGTAPVEQGEKQHEQAFDCRPLANANKTPAPVAQTEPAMTEEPAKKRGRPKKDLGINPPPVSMQVPGAAEALQEYVKPVDEAAAPVARP